jgi:hypothetical protein
MTDKKPARETIESILKLTGAVLALIAAFAVRPWLTPAVLVAVVGVVYWEGIRNRLNANPRAARMLERASVVVDRRRRDAVDTWHSLVQRFRGPANRRRRTLLAAGGAGVAVLLVLYVWIFSADLRTLDFKIARQLSHDDVTGLARSQSILEGWLLAANGPRDRKRVAASIVRRGLIAYHSREVTLRGLRELLHLALLLDPGVDLPGWARKSAEGEGESVALMFDSLSAAGGARVSAQQGVLVLSRDPRIARVRNAVQEAAPQAPLPVRILDLDLPLGFDVWPIEFATAQVATAAYLVTSVDSGQVTLRAHLPRTERLLSKPSPRLWLSLDSVNQADLSRYLQATRTFRSAESFARAGVLDSTEFVLRRYLDRPDHSRVWGPQMLLGAAGAYRLAGNRSASSRTLGEMSRYRDQADYEYCEILGEMLSEDIAVNWVDEKEGLRERLRLHDSGLSARQVLFATQLLDLSTSAAEYMAHFGLNREMSQLMTRSVPRSFDESKDTLPVPVDSATAVANLDAAVRELEASGHPEIALLGDVALLYGSQRNAAPKLLGTILGALAASGRKDLAQPVSLLLPTAMDVDPERFSRSDWVRTAKTIKKTAQGMIANERVIGAPERTLARRLSLTVLSTRAYDGRDTELANLIKQIDLLQARDWDSIAMTAFQLFQQFRADRQGALRLGNQLLDVWERDAHRPDQAPPERLTSASIEQLAAGRGLMMGDNRAALEHLLHSIDLATNVAEPDSLRVGFAEVRTLSYFGVSSLLQQQGAEERSRQYDLLAQRELQSLARLRAGGDDGREAEISAMYSALLRTGGRMVRPLLAALQTDRASGDVLLREALTVLGQEPLQLPTLPSLSDLRLGMLYLVAADGVMTAALHAKDIAIPDRLPAQTDALAAAIVAHAGKLVPAEENQDVVLAAEVVRIWHPELRHLVAGGPGMEDLATRLSMATLRGFAARTGTQGADADTFRLAILSNPDAPGAVRAAMLWQLRHLAASIPDPRPGCPGCAGRVATTEFYRILDLQSGLLVGRKPSRTSFLLDFEQFILPDPPGRIVDRAALAARLQAVDGSATWNIYQAHSQLRERAYGEAVASFAAAIDSVRSSDPAAATALLPGYAIALAGSGRDREALATLTSYLSATDAGYVPMRGSIKHRFVLPLGTRWSLRLGYDFDPLWPLAETEPRINFAFAERERFTYRSRSAGGSTVVDTVREPDSEPRSDFNYEGDSDPNITWRAHLIRSFLALRRGTDAQARESLGAALVFARANPDVVFTRPFQDPDKNASVDRLRLVGWVWGLSELRGFSAASREFGEIAATLRSFVPDSARDRPWAELVGSAPPEIIGLLPRDEPLDRLMPRVAALLGHDDLLKLESVDHDMEALVARVVDRRDATLFVARRLAERAEAAPSTATQGQVEELRRRLARQGNAAYAVVARAALNGSRATSAERLRAASALVAIRRFHEAWSLAEQTSPAVAEALLLSLPAAAWDDRMAANVRAFLLGTYMKGDKAHAVRVARLVGRVHSQRGQPETQSLERTALAILTLEGQRDETDRILTRLAGQAPVGNRYPRIPVMKLALAVQEHGGAAFTNESSGRIAAMYYGVRPRTGSFFLDFLRSRTRGVRGDPRPAAREFLDQSAGQMLATEVEADARARQAAGHTREAADLLSRTTVWATRLQDVVQRRRLYEQLASTAADDDNLGVAAAALEQALRLSNARDSDYRDAVSRLLTYYVDARRGPDALRTASTLARVAGASATPSERALLAYSHGVAHLTPELSKPEEAIRAFDQAYRLARVRPKTPRIRVVARYGVPRMKPA